MGKCNARALFVVMLLALAVLTTSGQQNVYQTYLYDFDLLGIDAAAIGRSDASVGWNGSISLAKNNPAILAYHLRPQVVTGTQLLADGSLSFLSGSYTTKSRGTFSVLTTYLDEGTLSQIDEFGNATGRIYDSWGFSFALNAARLVYESLSVGASLKGLYYKISNDAQYKASTTALVANVGIQQRFERDRIIWGAALNNVGISVDGYGLERNDPLPSAFLVGISYIPRNLLNVRIGLDAKKLFLDEYFSFKPAIEFSFQQRTLFLRAGGNLSSNDISYFLENVLGNGNAQTFDKSELEVFTLGAGYHYHQLRFEGGANVALSFLANNSQPRIAFSADFTIK